MQEEIVAELEDMLSEKGKHAVDSLLLVPGYMLPGLARYVMYGIKPGSFLKALMENDFLKIVTKADNENKSCLLNWALVVYSYLPMGCCGSPAKVKNWIEKGGLKGITTPRPLVEEEATAEESDSPLLY